MYMAFEKKNCKYLRKKLDIQALGEES
jgi:hypothetical protein